MVRVVGFLLIVATVAPHESPGAAESCHGLRAPVEGTILREFRPVGRYSGHWGVDWQVPIGSDVRAAGPGVVTFAGVVASNQTVTVHHGGGLRTSYSYLSELQVDRGAWVGSTTVLGSSGDGHGASAVHFSVRVGDQYLDPMLFLNCRVVDPSPALRLVPVRQTRASA